VSADFAGGAGHPPRLCLGGKPELTEAPRLLATAAEGIPEGFRQANPGRVAPGGAEARAPSPAPSPFQGTATHTIPGRAVCTRDLVIGHRTCLGILSLHSAGTLCDSWDGSPAYAPIQRGIP